MLKKKGDGKVIKNCRKVAVVEHLQPRILYSADVLAGLLPDPQTGFDDSARGSQLPWEQLRTVSAVVGANEVPESNSQATPLFSSPQSFSIRGTDPDGNVDAFRIISLPDDGTLSTILTGELAVGDVVAANNGSAGLRFTPDANWDGSSSFLFAAIDDEGLEDPTPAIRTVGDLPPANDAPEFTDLDGNTAFVLGGAPVYLDTDVTIFDTELSAIDDFDGALLMVSEFSGHTLGIDGVQVADGQPIVVSGTDIGTVGNNSMGVRAFQFNSDASNALVNEFLQSITYEYSGSNPPASIDLLWTFSDGSASSPDANGQTAVQLIDPTPTDLSTGIELNTDRGNDAYLISDRGLPASLSATTFEIRFAANDMPAELVLMSFNTAQGDEYSIQINANRGLELDFGSRAEQNSTARTYPTVLQDEQIHSLAVTWDSADGSWAVYLDGQLIDDGMGLNTGFALDTTNGQFVLGQEQDGLDAGYAPHQRFSGTIYDVRIWDDVRTAAEIALNYQNKFDPTSGDLPAGLVANWQFDGFDESNPGIDVVNGNNLSLRHASGNGFTSSTPVSDLHIAEDATSGTKVGYVVPTDVNETVASYTYTLDDASNNFVIDNTGRITVAVTNTLDFEANESHDVIVEVTDAEGNVYEDVVTITVDNVNDAPTFDVGSGNTLNGTVTTLEGASVVIDSDVQIFDDDLSALNGGMGDFGGATLTVLASGTGSGHEFEPGGSLSFDIADVLLNGDKKGTFTTSVDRINITFDDGVTNDEVNQIMQSLRYNNTSDAPPASVELTWTFNDNNDGLQGTGGALTAVGSTIVNIDPVNDAPVVSRPGSSYSFTEQGTLDIHGTGFSVTDIDANGGTLAAVLAVGEGRLLLDAGNSGVSILAGNSTDTVTITGTEAQLNALLEGTSSGTIVYRHDQTAASDTPSAFTLIRLTVSDQGNAGRDPGLTGNARSEVHTANQAINITAVNDGPMLLGTELITNGDLADGDLTGWTTTGEAGFRIEQIQFGGGDNVGPHTASQTINTVAGQNYVLEFDYEDGGDLGTRNQQLNVSVDGAANLLRTGSIVTDTTDSSAVRYRYTFTADSSSTTIIFTDTSDDVDSLSSGTSSVDGRLDNISVRQSGNSLNSVTFTEAGTAVTLNSDIAVADAELSNIDNFGGTTLALARAGGANADDDFVAVGNLAFAGSTFELSGVQKGAYSEVNGVLLLTFDASVTNAEVNEIMQSIAYQNLSNAPPASVDVGWIFNDNNNGSQGAGAAVTVVGSTTVNINGVNDAPVVSSPGTSYDFTEQGSLNIHGTGFSVTDVDANGAALEAILTVGEGRLLLDAGNSGVTIVSGNSTDTVTVTGTEAQLNALLEGSSSGTIVYRHDQTAASDTPSSSTTIGLTVNDQGNTGTDPGLTGSEEDSASQTINITAVNDSPTLLGTELITNGNLATGDLSGWTPTGQVVVQGQQLVLGNGNIVGPHTASQAINTVAGQNYVLEFDYRDAGDLGTRNQQLNVSVDGTANLLLTESIVTDIAGSRAVRYSYTFTADSSSTIITFTDTSDDVDSFSSETTAVDGRLDNISVRQSGDNLNTVTFGNAGIAVTLNSDIEVADAELSDINNFGGTTLTLVRTGGANANDDFVAVGNLAFAGSTFELSGVQKGAYSEVNGTLLLTFAAGVTNAEVNEIMQSIAYQNLSNTPPASVDVEWTFNDNNNNDLQGIGGALTALATTTVNINQAPVVDLDLNDSDAPGSGFVTMFTENGGQVFIADSDASLSDIDDTHLSELTVQITNQVDGINEQLDVNSGVTGLAADYDELTGELTISGIATVAQYQQVLRTITYENLSEDPDQQSRDLLITVTDSVGAVSEPVTSRVFVFALNDAPVGANGLVTVMEDDARFFQLSDFGFTDTESHGLSSVLLTTLPSLGTLTFDGTAVVAGQEIAVADIPDLLYTANPNADGTDISFTFQVRDDGGTTNGGFDTDDTPNRMDIVITPVNDAPTTTPVALTGIAEDGGTRQITQAELLANASDIENDNLTAENLLLVGGNGTLIDNNDGTWGYTPAADDDTDVSFDYTVTDGTDSTDASATLDIIPVNDAPTTTPVVLIGIAEDSGSRQITQAELLANVVDIEGGNLTAENLLLVAGNGTLIDNNDGTWSYTPAADDDTDVSFDYTVTDGTDNTDASATLDIIPVNDAPITTPVALTGIAEDSGTRQLTQAELLANAVDIEGDNLTAENLSLVAGSGTLIDNNDGTWSYTPAADDDTDVSFDYTVTDGTDSTDASATLDIIPVNDAPTITPVALTGIAEDSGTRQITQLELLSNASDTEGNNLTAENLSLVGGNGTLIDNNDGTWSYTPAADDDTDVGFDYTVTDGTDITDASATLDITSINDAPTSTLVTLSTIEEDSGVRLITQAELLSNAVDIEGDELTAGGLIINSGNGSLVSNSDGTWSYTPADNDDSEVSFAYTVFDNTANVVGSAMLDIVQVNDVPTTTPVTLAPIAEDSNARLITQAELLTAAGDIEGDGLTALGLVVDGGNGTLIDNGDSTWSYTPAVDDDSDVSFTYTITDGQVNVAGTATLDLTPVNDAPEGSNTTVQMPEDTTYVLGVGDFPFTDVSDGDEFSGIVIVSLPASGELSLSGVSVVATDFIDARDIANGALVFIPALDQVSPGTDALEYLLRDNGGTVNGGVDVDPVLRQVNFIVTAVNDAPQIITNVATLDEGNELLIGSEFLSGSDIDNSPQDLTYTLQSQPDNGALSVAGVVLSVGDQFTLAEIIDNQLHYVHDGSETSSDFVELSLADGGEDGAAAVLGRLSFIINEVIDRAPSIENDQFTLEFGKTFSSEGGDLLASGFAALSGNLLQENDGLTLTIEQAPEQGTLEVDATGNFTYVHNDSPVLQDEFTYRVTNEDGIFTLATVSILIEPAVGALISNILPVDFPNTEIGTETGSEIDSETDSSAALEVEQIEQAEEQTEEQGQGRAGERIFDLFSTSIAEASSPDQQTSLTISEPVRMTNVGQSDDEEYDRLEVIQHNKVTSVLLAPPELSINNTILEVTLDNHSYGVSKGNYLGSLAQIDSVFNEVQREEGVKAVLTNEALFSLTFSATAGVLTWVLRGGSLLASVLASTPIWSTMDPVRVFSSSQREQTSDEVEAMFEKK